MEVTNHQNTYIVLNSLDDTDRAQYLANLQPLAFFAISPVAHILITEIKGEALGYALLPGLKTPGRVTIIRLHGAMELLTDRPHSWPLEFLTVFDK